MLSSCCISCGLSRHKAALPLALSTPQQNGLPGIQGSLARVWPLGRGAGINIKSECVSGRHRADVFQERQILPSAGCSHLLQAPHTRDGCEERPPQARILLAEQGVNSRLLSPAHDIQASDLGMLHCDLPSHGMGMGMAWMCCPRANQHWEYIYLHPRGCPCLCVAMTGPQINDNVFSL